MKFRWELEESTMPTAEDLEVNAGELHRIVGSYPGDHRMPQCCEVMRREAKRGGGETIFETDSGDGAALTIRYLLPR